MQIRSLTSGAGALIGLLQSLGPETEMKPALHSDLEYCGPPLMDNLASTQSTSTQWPSGWIPQECATMATEAKLKPADVQVYNVTYTDCDDPWILCRHKRAPYKIDELIDVFGRLPVGTRQWVRHLASFPDSGSHAYNSDGSIALFNTFGTLLTVLFHESGHSLDAQGAFKDTPLSSSFNWYTAYNLDSAVPDGYAQSDQEENVAQNTVIAAFDQNVPGGFPSIENGWEKIKHQFSLIQKEANEAGNLLKPGGRCTQRLDNSEPIQVGGSKKTRRSDLGRPNVARSPHIKAIEGKKFDTRNLACSFAHKH